MTKKRKEPKIIFVLQMPSNLNRYYLILPLIISFIVGGCSSSNLRNLEVSISSPNSVSLFDSITIDGSNSKGNEFYKWTLVGVPEIVDLEAKERYETEINSNTGSIISFTLGHPGPYTIQLTIEDSDGFQKSSTHDFEVLPICENSFNYTNLITESFDSSENWFPDNPPEDFNNQSCHNDIERVAGYTDIGNGYMEIFSGSAIGVGKARRMSMSLNNKIEFDENKNYRIRISISGYMQKPFYWDLGITYYNTNFDLNIIDKNLKIKTTIDTSKWENGPLEGVFRDNLDIYCRPNNGNPILFVCNQGQDNTRELELNLKGCCSSGIVFSVFIDNGETSCWLPSKLKISEFIIDEFE